jgi:hypothetical protein
MSKLGLVIVLILMAGRDFAQDHFVLIQADNRQPFYVRLNSQLYSSSEGGHLILAQLKDSPYTITIGFPGQVFPEQRFSFNIDQKDRDFRLKSEDGKGWRVYDEGGQELQMPDVPAGGGSGKSGLPGIKKDDAFSRLMAEVVHDTAVMYNTYAMEAILSDSAASAKSTPVGHLPGADSPVVAAAGGDSIVAAGGNPVVATGGNPNAATSGRPIAGTGGTTVAVAGGVGHDSSAISLPPSSVIPDTVKSADTGKASPGHPSVDSSLAPKSVTISSRPDSAASSPPVYRPSSGVVKLSERKSPKSLRLVYADHAAGSKADTIVVIIPMDTPNLVTRGVASSSSPRTTHPADTVRPAVPPGHGINPDSPVLGAVLRSRPADTAQKRPATKAALPFVNSDCHNYATDYDVDKLRVKMLESGKDDDRIQVARKVFKTKCFSTRQIRALSEVFTTDASKFRFLEAAYPFVSDDHFPELANLLSDPVYVGKFKAMTDRQ